MKIFVEGGGDAKDLRTACRKGFRFFLEKAGLKGQMPAVVACGSRQQAYNDFCTANRNGENALLLVDSEEKVKSGHQRGDPKTWQPWGHLYRRKGDQWMKPQGAHELDCHLMVQCMEAWFLADRSVLETFFGQGFNNNALPPEARPVETIEKKQIYQTLANATKACKTKAKYGKGAHSFKILEQLAPARVIEASPWTKRFVETAISKMN